MCIPAKRLGKDRAGTASLALCLLASAPVWALSSDRDQPIQIESNSVEIDDKLRVAIYRGNVVVTQGTIRFTGHTMTVKYGEGQALTEVLMEGSPATFKQRPDNSDEDLYAESLKMRYDKQEELVHLIEQAKVIQRGQVYTSPSITYDTRRSFLTASKGEGEAAGGETARVKIVLPPDNKDDKGQRRNSKKPRLP